MDRTVRPSWVQDSAHCCWRQGLHGTVLCRTEISTSTAHYALAIPRKKGREWASLLPLPVPSPLMRGFVGAVGRLPVAGFSESRQAESAGLDLASRTRLHAGSRLFLQPASGRRLSILVS